MARGNYGDRGEGEPNPLPVFLFFIFFPTATSDVEPELANLHEPFSRASQSRVCEGANALFIFSMLQTGSAGESVWFAGFFYLFIFFHALKAVILHS